MSGETEAASQFPWTACLFQAYDSLLYFYKSINSSVWAPKWETLKKEGLALRFRAKMAPGRRDEGVA